jgi:hypothetical protein
MENDESVLITKQELLKTEIIDKHYDKEVFLEYCTARKEDGDDLSIWTLEELKAIIEQFQDEYCIVDTRQTMMRGSDALELREDFDKEIEKLDMDVRFVFI